MHDKRVLIVDDDTRNIFALEAALDEYGMQVVTAESGLEGLEHASARDDIDIVLMDIMMPEMDGYETIRRIRAEPHRRTAHHRADRKGDERRPRGCIAAGASEYISKPVDIDQLTSLLKIWLSK